jgi:hypothetical protein
MHASRESDRAQKVKYLRGTWADAGAVIGGEFASIKPQCLSVNGVCMTVDGRKVMAVSKTAALPDVTRVKPEFGVPFDLDSAIMRETFASSLVVRGLANDFCLVYALDVRDGVVHTLAEFGGATFYDTYRTLDRESRGQISLSACAHIARAMATANSWMPRTHAEVASAAARQFFQGDLHTKNVLVTPDFAFRIIDFFGMYSAYKCGAKLSGDDVYRQFVDYLRQLDALYEKQYYAVADVCHFAIQLPMLRPTLASVPEYIRLSLQRNRPQLLMLQDLDAWFNTELDERRPLAAAPETTYHRIVEYRFPYTFHDLYVHAGERLPAGAAVSRNHSQLEGDYDAASHKPGDTYRLLPGAGTTLVPVTLPNRRQVLVTPRELAALQEMFVMDGGTCTARKGWQCMYCGHVHVAHVSPGTRTCAECFMSHAWLCSLCFYGNHDKSATACGDCGQLRRDAAAGGARARARARTRPVSRGSFRPRSRPRSRSRAARRKSHRP